MIKINFYFLFIVITGLILFSCKNQGLKPITKEFVYELGWQTFENNFKGNYAVAERKFDSLLMLGIDFQHSFLIDGLDTKNKLGKTGEIDKILGTLDEDALNYICHVDFLRTRSTCSCCLEQEVNNQELQHELVKMYVNDQSVRGNIPYDLINKYQIDTTLIARTGIGKVDLENRNRLIEIIDEHGFPNRFLVGKEGMRAVFIFIQHADREPEWQKDQLIHIKKAVDEGELDAQKYAYLYDRIQVNSGEKQLYGTQFGNVDMATGVATLAETEDIEGLYQRRMEFGMMPIDLYKRIILNLSN